MGNHSLGGLDEVFIDVENMQRMREFYTGVLGVDEEFRGYVNRCVNDIRRRPSQPLSQRRSHPRIERRDRRLRSTQGPSDA